jgi:imidazolonepropionase-like amidohydrolase
MENSGTPEKLRELVRQRKEEGADLIKLFASKSIREGGAQTMTDAQLQAACGEAKSLGMRTLVHAHSAESMKAATLAGCTSVEHGAYATDEVFSLMAERGTYYDPNIGLVLQNYLENKPRFLGQGNYNEEGFAFMEKGIAITRDTFKKALTHKNPRSSMAPMPWQALTGRITKSSLCVCAMADRIPWPRLNPQHPFQPNR